MLPRISPLFSTAVLVFLGLLAFTATHWPMPHKLMAETTHLLPQFDKLVHVTIYAVLAIVLLIVFGSWKFHWSVSLIVTVWLSLVTWGAFDELTQTLVAGRSCDPADLIADAIGVSIGIGVIAWARGRSVEQWLLPSESRS